MLHGHVPAALAKFNVKPLGRLPGSNEMQLVIGLPLRNKDALTNLIQQLYDPASTNFHRYLDPAQFTERFGPTVEDYQKVINFANANHLEVTSTSADRVLLEVRAPVSTVENTLHVTLLTYQHPTEARQFFAPDIEPTVDTNMPAIFVSGLNNFYKPHPMAQRESTAKNRNSSGGSAPNGSSFIGGDFRHAYAPGVTLTGSGQMVGLVEFEGYYASDITNYENLAGISTSFPLQNVVLPGFSMDTTDTDGIRECSLDIEMVIAMAPGLSKLYVFEGSQVSDTDTMLGWMTSSNQIKQFSTSWAMTKSPTAEGYLMKMATQGQSFFAASGDGDAYVNGNTANNWPCDDPYITSVGGTTLTMSGSGTSYVSEQVWNWGWSGPNAWFGNGQTSLDPYWGSGGGISPTYSIPVWQQGVNMTAVGGSSTMRNIPDVALTADQVWVNYNHTSAGNIGGTSCAAPLWAGFSALVNQLAASQGLTSVGFLNPSLYAIGEGSSYNSCFNDVDSGNNFWPGNPSEFNSAVGYDLCTGWGTPKGLNLILALMAFGSSVWVDFNYTGTTSDGTYNFPYKTVAQGINAVPTGGNIWIRTAGSSPETMSIIKPLTIRAFNGAATIGQ